jgi:hypothetical protein
MSQKKFEEWIKKEQPNKKTFLRYPSIIITISNHFKKKNMNNYDLYSVNDEFTAKELKETYLPLLNIML